MSEPTTRGYTGLGYRGLGYTGDYEIRIPNLARFEVWRFGKLKIAYSKHSAAQSYIDRQSPATEDKSILGLPNAQNARTPDRPTDDTTDRPIKQLQITLTEDPNAQLTDDYAARLYEIIRDLLNEDPRSQCPEDPYVALIAQLCALADVDPGYPNNGTLRQQWIGYRAEWQTQYHPHCDTERTDHDRPTERPTE